MNILCACRDEQGHITHFGIESLTPGVGVVLLTAEQVREQIENGTRFFVRTKGTDQEVKALHDPDSGEFQYLNIYPESKHIDDVHDLDECDLCG